MRTTSSSFARLPRAGAAAVRRFGFMTTVSTAALIAAAGSAAAQTPQAAQAPAVEEIVVTGSRVVRDGYEAPTPVTVIGTEQMEAQPMQHITDFVNRLPAFGGAQTTTSGGNEISTGRQSQNNLNLRSLESYRTLVLLDGNRIVTGDVNGSVNASDLPTPLISRVDVVTGGASAAYGSDAVAGVVNFILDKEFVGVKGEVQGGITNYGDDPSYKVSLTGGYSFAGGRGHILFSGEHAWNKGIYGASKSRGDFWGYDTGHLVENPLWGTNTALGQSPTNPRWLVRSQAATLLATPGGIITSGPLKGIAFNPDGTPRGYTYGSITNSQFTVGGDWKYSDATYYNQTLSNKVSRQAFFVRASYEITDSVTAYVNLLNTFSYGFARSKLDDKLGNITIKADNPYLNESVRSQMTALKLTTFTMGSFLLDIPYITTDNWRNLWSYSGGFNGKFDALDTSWTWDLHAQQGLVRSDLNGRVVNNTNFALAVDSTRDPVTNKIVCRSTLTAPANGCVPFNPFGSGVNDSSAIAYVKQTAVLYQRNTESTFSLGVSGGEPFNTWAGPVSVASGFEWRREAVTPGNIAAYCPFCLTSSYTAGNYKGTKGSYSVAEGYVEIVAPLAKDTVWARSLDLNAAVRATGYSTSGYVTTWKAGLTYNPIDEIRFRATRSRDIRAPNLGDLYNGGGGGQSPGLIDPFRPGAPPVTYLNSTSGNPALQPEKADTTGLGVVLQPAFFPGFSASVDFYDINIKGAIDTIGGQEILDRCYAGQLTQCSAVQRNAPTSDGYSVGTIRIIDVKPFNLAALHQRGYDFEASYQTKLDQVVDSWNGDVSFRAIGTYIQFFKRDDGRNAVIDAAGTNAGQGPLKWRWMFSANYTNDPLSITWTGRFMSSGKYGGTATTYVQCNPGSCPVSTTSFPTIDYNYIESRFYHDLAVTYKILETDAGGSTQLFVNISNLMNTPPPFIVSSNYWYMTVNPQMYDTIGRRFYAGVRFKM